MNILPHKSWHVRTKKNIARVHRDEERAKKEEEELQKRINLAEHEARIAQLKHKARIQNGQNDNLTVSKSNSESFDLLNDFKDKILGDSEKSSEKKIEQEKWEVRAGIFSYLDGRYKYDQNKNDDEWYLKFPEERLNSESKSSEHDNNKTKNTKDERNKILNDPLENMKSYLAVIKKNESSSLILCESTNNKTKRYTKSNDFQSDYFDSRTSSSKKKKKHKKHKKRKHDSSDDSDSNNKDEANQKKLLLEKLRAERLDREKKERDRTMILLRGSALQETTDIKQKYNSQFNPHLARQNLIE